MKKQSSITLPWGADAPVSANVVESDMLSGTTQRRGALATGTLVGDRYRVVAPLARGGFGVVYVAEQIATERRVALKILHPHLDGVSVERLLAEARIPSRLSSDHIVQVIDAGIDHSSGTVFLAMELLTGLTLAELVRRRGPLPAAQVVEYLRQVGSGLDKAHGWVDRDGRPAPIVHRDLKPENLFLTQREDGTALVKILDFGTAKVLSQTTQASGVLLGTPQYMAYEQAAGELITPATDVWALGLVTFFLLTGRSYWLAVAQQGAYAQLFGEVLSLPLAPATQRAQELGVPLAPSGEFDAWFARCVNRDVRARFPSATSAVQELARALGVTGREATTPSPQLLRDLGSNGVPGATVSELATAPTEGVRLGIGPELHTQDRAALARASSHARGRTRFGRAAGAAALVVLLAVAALSVRSALVRGSGAELQSVARTPAPDAAESAASLPRPPAVEVDHAAAIFERSVAKARSAGDSAPPAPSAGARPESAAPKPRTAAPRAKVRRTEPRAPTPQDTLVAPKRRVDVYDER